MMVRLLRALALSSLLVPALALAEEPARTADGGSDEAKVVCKKYAETGSLVKKRRVCMTQKQWRAVAVDAQDRGRELQTAVGTERGN